MTNKKVVVKTVQTIVRTYFVEVPDPEWACDGICMGDLEEYSQKHMKISSRWKWLKNGPILIKAKVSMPR